MPILLAVLIFSIITYDLTGRPAWHAVLPAGLTEISGQAFTPDGRLFAHGDERAAIYRLDPKSGRIIDGFTVSPSGHDPDMGARKGRRGDGRAVVGDFEDMAVANGRFFLVSSNGVLLEFNEGRQGAAVPYRAHDTGLAGACEVEGMTHDAQTHSLLLLCKNEKGKGKEGRVTVYAWSLAAGKTDPSPRLEISAAALRRATGAREFNGSAIGASPDRRSFLLVAGPQQAFAEIDRAGRVLRGGRFPRGLYRQPEGAAFGPDGTLVISSEGAGRRATLGGYVPSRR